MALLISEHGYFLSLSSGRTLDHSHLNYTGLRDVVVSCSVNV